MRSTPLWIALSMGCLMACDGDMDAADPAAPERGAEADEAEGRSPGAPGPMTPGADDPRGADPGVEHPGMDDPDLPPGMDPDPPMGDPPGDDPVEPDPPDEPVMQPCPAGATCFDHLPSRIEGDTRQGEAAIDAWACAPEVNEGGPELWYAIQVPEAGFLALELGGLADGVDVDVHLLSADETGTPAPERCINRGHWRAGAAVTPGRYWIAADSWVTDAGEALPGAFSMTLHLTTAADLVGADVDPVLAEDAVHAFGVAWAEGQTDRFEYAVIDFSLHSAVPREWVFDMATGDLLWRLHVAHGRSSSNEEDLAHAVRFSNVPESHQSSLGLLRTAEAYIGDWGISYRLDGLEEGYNHNVRRRDIVMHPWEESRPEYVDEHGMVRPTWGCPAIDDRVSREVVERLAGGVLMLFWFPDGDWSVNSAYLP